VVVLAGTEGAGTAEVAAALCAGYARVGLSAAALGLDGVRAAVALATNTEDAAVSVGIAEDVEDVRRALPRLGRPDLLVAIAPTVVPGDEARRARTAELLAELPAHDLHLVLPSGATAADAQSAFDALAGTTRVKGVLPVALDEAATVGGVVSLALRERLEIRWTASGAGRLATAVPDDLAWRTLA
jgi:flagellar biosynthesis GTPase FlhF